MSSYYKRIGGVNYDRSMIETANKSIKGKGDGRVSIEDAKALVKDMKDGGKVTEIELKTLDYIYKNYKFTEAAFKYIEESLSDLNSKDKKAADHNKPKRSQKEPQHKNEPSESTKKSKNKIKYLIIFLCIILLLLIIILLAGPCSQKNANKGELVPAQKNEERAAAKNTTDAAGNKDLKNNAVSADNKNGYVIKKNDTLTRISKAVYGNYSSWKNIYNANEDKIKNPNMIYQGQVLTIPEKKEETGGNASK